MLDREKVKPWMLSIFTFCLVFFPMYLYYIRFRLGAAIYFLAGDAFYYLDVARNSQGLTFFTFDGLHATNGFHPLWQYLLTYLAHLPQFSFSGRDPINHIFLLDLFIVSIGYGFLAIFAAKQVHLSWLIPIALCPGLTWFIISIADSNYLSAWSFVNGMESGLSLLCFGVVLLFFGRTMPNGWRLILGTFFLGLAVLSRLDDVFFLLAFFAYAIWRSPQHRLRATLPFVAPFLMIAAYVLYNRITVGAYLPVSGATKFSLALGNNLLWTLFASLPTSWDLQPFPAAPLLDYSLWAELAMRLFQLWFPILMGGGYLAVGYKRRTLQNRPVLSCLCAGTLAKGLYNLIFVVVWSEGSWYYPISIFTCNVVLAVVLDKVLQYRLRDRPRFGHPILQYAGIPSMIALFTWFCFFGFIAHKDAEQSGRATYQTYNHGLQIANDIHNAGATVYLELDDGLVSYATGMPGISALGLATDVEAVKAKKEGRYLDLMDSRGVHVIVASGSYISGMNRMLQAGVDPGAMLGNIQPSEYARYSIEIGPHDEDSNITIYRIVKKSLGVITEHKVPGY
jgi:hypothetical protein